MVCSLVSLSVPVFWLGQVANLVTQDVVALDVLFRWVPPLGYTPITEDPVMWFRHLVIPWVVLATLYVGLYARIFRSALIETGGQDFVRTARAKGIWPSRGRSCATSCGPRWAPSSACSPSTSAPWSAAARCWPRWSSGCPASAGSPTSRWPGSTCP